MPEAVNLPVSFTAKVLVIGPSKAGKTALANYLADFIDTPNPEYHATQGARILEFERDIPREGTKGGRDTIQRVAVELWDCSGDRKFESCWPAMLKDVHGMVFVFNPDMKNHDREIELWYKWFAGALGLKDSQVCCFGHQSMPEQRGGAAPKKVDGMLLGGRLRVVSSTLDKDSDKQNIKQEFDVFLSSMIAAVVQQRDNDENLIMNG